jgi:threonyl-tRNA synthetase
MCENDKPNQKSKQKEFSLLNLTALKLQKMSKNRSLRRIYGFKRKKRQEAGEKCIIRS